MEFDIFEELFKNAFGVEELSKVKDCVCDETGKMSFEKLGIFVGLYQLLPFTNQRLIAPSIKPLPAESVTDV
jgi:hypothetical protein